jgi:phage recombination protein Bet
MSQAVAIRQQFDNEQLALIQATVAKGTTPEEFRLFVEVCKYHRLNPFARQIYAVVRNGKSGRQLTIQTSIEGYRLLAERSGKYAGQLGPQWAGKDGEWRDVWLEDSPPVAARVGVLRKDFAQPVWGVAKYKAFYVDSNPLWSKMPDHMLAIRAEAIALRKAFPAEMSGIYTKEEMEQADDEVSLPTVTVEASVEQETHLNGQEHVGVSAHPSHNGKAISRPSQSVTEASKPDIKTRFQALYQKAGKLNLFEYVPGDPKATSANFFKLVSEIVHANVTSSGQMTPSRLDDIEAYITSKDGPAAEAA